MKTTTKQKLIKTVEIIDRLIELKCGGPGSGVPGPCPSGQSGGGGGGKTPAKFPSRRPDYAFADTTVPGLKAAAKDAGIKIKGGKTELVRGLADAYHKDTSQFKSAKSAETAYVCYYAEQRRFWNSDGTKLQ